MSVVHDGDDTSPAANELMSRDLVNLEAFRGWRDVVDRDVEGRRLCGEGVEHVSSEVDRKVLRWVVNVVGVPARLAPKIGEAAFGVASRHVGGKVEVQQLVVKGPAIGDGGGWCRAYGDDLEGVYPIEGELGLENGGVGASLGTLADGCNGVLDAGPTADGERRRSAEGVHVGGVAAVGTRYVNGVKFPDSAISVAGGKKRGRCKLDVRQRLGVEDREGNAKKAALALGASPVATLTEWLQALSTFGCCRLSLIHI